MEHRSPMHVRRPASWWGFLRSIKRRLRRGGKTARSLEALAARLEKLEHLTEHPEIMALTKAAQTFPSPAVSVVMPTWNRAGIIGAAIRSVRAQSFEDWELIVVDDGSTDDTEAVVASFAADRRISYARQEHAGQSAARNRALRSARGALVAYLDSDNLWYPDIDCAYGAMLREPHGKRPRIWLEPFDRERLLHQNIIGMSMFVHRFTMVERHGAFDERLEALEDWDIVLRYTATGPAYRLPVRAVRQRVLDEHRVSDTRRHDAADALIRSKWTAR